MKVLVSGHRLFKLQTYSIDFIKLALAESINLMLGKGMSLGLSGMASGVDLWFCDICYDLSIPYYACVPFEDQDTTMDNESREQRQNCLKHAKEIKSMRNSSMVEQSQAGIIVWDGNKGGTHNVFQQMLEKHKPFVWIEPNNEKVVELF